MAKKTTIELQQEPVDPKTGITPSTKKIVDLPEPTLSGGTSYGQEFKEDMSKFTPYIQNVFPDQDIYKQRAIAQSGWEQGKNAVIGGLASGLATAVEDFSYIPNIFMEDWESNAVAETMHSFKEGIGEAMPIYRESPDQVFDMDDPAFYWDSVKGILDSVGFGISGGVVSGTLGKAGKAAGLYSKLKKLEQSSRVGQKVSAMARALENSTSFNRIANALPSGIILNDMEGTVMGVELYDELMQEYAPKIEAGDMTVEQAKELAAQRANQFKLNNRVFALTDALGVYGLHKGAGFTRNLLKQPGFKNRIKSLGTNLGTPNADNLIVQGGKEYLEEVGQNVLQSEQVFRGKEEANKQFETDFDIEEEQKKGVFGRGIDFALSEKAQYEGMLGFFGGGPQRILSEAMSGRYTKSAREQTRKLYEDQQETITKNEEYIQSKLKEEVTYHKLLEKALLEGDENTEKLLKDQKFATLAAENFKNGTTENLERHLQDIADGNIPAEMQGSLGTDSQQKATELLAELDNLETQWLKASRYLNQEQVYKESLNVDIFNKQADLYEGEINKEKTDLTSEAQRIASKYKIKEKDEFGDYEENLKFNTDNLEKNPYKGENAKIYQKFFDEVQDTLPWKKLQGTKQNEGLLERYDAIQDVLKRVRKKHSDVTSVAYQEALQKEAKRNEETVKKIADLPSIKSISELELMLKSSDNEMVSKAIQDRIEEVKAEVKQTKKERDDSTKEKRGEETIADSEEDPLSMFEQDAPRDPEVNPANKESKFSSEANSIADAAISEFDDALPAEEETKDKRLARTKIIISLVDQLKKDGLAGSFKEVAEIIEERAGIKKLKKIFKKLQGIYVQTNEDHEFITFNEYKGISKRESDSLEVGESNQEKSSSELYGPKNDQEVDVVLEELSKTLSEINASSDVTPDGSIVYDYTRSKKAANKFGFLSRLFKQIFSGGTVTREDISDELNKKLLDKRILDPNKFGKGTTIILKEKEGYDGPVYNPDSNEKETMEWVAALQSIKDEAKAQGEDYRDTDAYKERVPIVITDSEGREIAYLHELEWVTEENVKPENVEQERERLKKIRNAVVGKTDGIKTTITEKTAGILFRNTEGKVPLTEAMPDPNITFAIGDKGLLKINREESFDGKILNKEISAGHTYAVVKVSEDAYMAIPLNRTLASKEVATSIRKAIEVYINQDFSSPMKDMTNINNLRNYVKTLLQLTSLEKNQSLESLLQDGSPDKPLFAVTGNSIQFGRPQVMLGGKQHMIELSQNTPQEQKEKFLNKLEETIQKAYLNVDLTWINNKEHQVKLINSDGTVSPKNYRTFLKENIKSDVLSHNIGTEEKPSWIYTVQPGIYFDESFINEKPQQKPEQKSSDIEDKKADIEKRRQEELSKLNQKKLDFEIMNFQVANPIYHEGMLKGGELGKKTAIDAKYDAELVALENQSKPSAKPKPTIVAPDGTEVVLPDTDADLDSDDSLPVDEQESADKALQETVDKLLIKGTTVAFQQEWIDSIAGDYIRKIINSEKEISSEELFKEWKDTLDSIYKVYEDAGKTKAKKIKQLKALIDNFDQLQSLVKRDLLKLSGVKVSDEIDKLSQEETDGLFEKTDFTDEFNLTLDSKNTASANLKRFLAFVPDKNPNGTDKTNIFGFKKYVPFDEAYNTLHGKLAGIRPDMKEVEARLSEAKIEQPWIQNVLDMLFKAPIHTKNEFLSDMTKHYVPMRFVMWNKNRDGSYELIDYDVNANAVASVIQQSWENNLNMSPTVSLSASGEYYIPETTLKDIVARADKWNKKSKNFTKRPSNKELQQWFDDLGIELSDEAISSLMQGKFRDANGIKWKYGDLFDQSNGLINRLSSKLEGRIVGKGKDPITLSSNNFLKDSSIGALAKLESKHSFNYYSNSHRSGKKTIYSYSNNKYLVNRIRDLKDQGERGKALREKLGKLSFSEDSLWLEELNNEEGFFRGEFNYSYLGLEALKKLFTKSKDNKELYNISEAEHETAKIGFFQNSYVTREDKLGRKRRKMKLFFPTMSDKTTVMMLNLYGYEVKTDIETGEISEDTWEFLYDALIKPEIKRMQSFKKDANLKEGEYEPSYFYFIPALNTMMSGDITVREHVLNGDSFDEDTYQIVMDTLKSTVNGLINDKVSEWKDMGIGLNGDKQKNTLLNKQYMDKIAQGKDSQTKVKYAASDMVINYMIANAEMHKTIIGDPALYAKFKKGKSIQENMEASFINLGKRLAAENAPGIEIADSYDNEYIQLFFTDRENQNKSIVKDYYNTLNLKVGKAYDKINGTDAQEWTTWREHIYVLRKMGKILDKDYNRIIQTLEKGESLSDTDLGVILQPVKPVYVDNKIEVENNLERKVYIKSSSFPLIPQLTSGLDIDKVRVAMENVEKNHPGKTVRAAFDSAAKVGNVKESLNIWNDDGSIGEINIDLDKHSLTLSRRGFRIQQDIPFKDKDVINIGTQERKLLFSNILNTKGFTFEGEEMNGKDLKKIYDDTYHTLYKEGHSELMEEITDPETGMLNGQALQKILLKEAESRGYSLNDIEGLEMKNGEFVLPLWISPSASKYESLLNSIINNRVIKQKFPGRSYVLGSEEGFKSQVKEGEEARKEIASNKGIITTDQYDASTGLKPARRVKKSDYEKNGIEVTATDADAKSGNAIMLPAQLIAPMNFRNNKGKLLDINKFTKKVNGKTVIDHDKLPKELLKMFGFRIPTQGHNSMAYMEIVGFLPKESGDLLLAPRDFVAQMGSDFDVDKLYTYQYNTFLDDKGILSKNTEGKKSIQNKILDIHFSVMSNPSNEVQSKISEPLGFGKFKDTPISHDGKKHDGLADMFSHISQRGETVSILSDSYQREKYVNATAGKAGTGAFSLDSVFNAISQEHNLTYIVGKDGTPLRVKFEGIPESNGDLSNPMTLSGKRYKSDVISAYQSASVDNEKEQIMDKLNINSDTFDAIRILNQLGFEEDIVAAFINQPIILEYIKELNKATSTLSDYNPNAEKDVMEKLRAKYDPQLKYLLAEKEEFEQYEKLADGSFKTLVGYIENGKLSEGKSTEFGIAQIALLEKFKDLSERGREIKKIQSAINSDSAGIGKNLFYTQSKKEQIENLITSPIENATELLGKFNSSGELISPTTTNGYAAYYGVYAADMWKSLFPYHAQSVQGKDSVIDEVFKITEQKIESLNKTAELKQEIFEEVKSFLFTNPELRIFEGDINNKRRELFKDTDVNQSLATILDKLSSEKWYITNPFLNRLSFELNKNGNISKVKFDAAAGENFDEKNIYLGFAQLLKEDKPIGKFNGKEYTTRDIANNLISYVYLEGGIQQAIQFIKYIPVSYLEKTSFGRIFRDINLNDESVLGTFPGKLTPYFISRFTRQWAQHNPSKLIAFDLSDVEGNIKDVKKLPDEFSLTKEGRNKLAVNRPQSKVAVSPEFLAIRDTDAPGKFRIFQYMEGVYRRIDTLGTFGMKEYNFSSDTQNTILSTPTSKKVNTPKQAPTTPLDVIKERNKTNDPVRAMGFNTSSNGKQIISKTLDNIKKSSSSEYHKELATYLIESLDNLPEGLKTNLIFNTSEGKGEFNHITNIFTINKAKLNSQNEFEQAFLHETIHAFVNNKIKTWEKNPKSDTLTKRDIELITNLKKTQKKYINKLNTKDKKSLGEFYNKYWNWKLEKGNITEAEFKKKIETGPGSDSSIPEGKSFTSEEISRFYGGIKLTEFVTMALTDEGFQSELNQMEDKDGGTFWETIAKVLKDLLDLMGLDIKENSLLATAVDNSLALIKEKELKQPSIIPEAPPIPSIDDLNISAPDNIKPMSLFDIGISDESLSTEQRPYNLGDNKELYKKYNLLSKEGKIKTVPDNGTTKKWVQTLNLSPNYAFKLRKTTEGSKILIFPKRLEDIINSRLKNKLC